jgi:hypothetical protein
MSTSSAVTSWSPSSFSSERRTSNLSAVWWWTNLAISAAFVDGESSSVGGVDQVQDAAVMGALFGAPAQGALGFVVVPGDGGGAAVAGEDGREHDDRGGLVRPALAVDDGNGPGAGPVLADGADVFALGQFFGGGVHPEAKAGEGTAPALRGRFQDRGADQERGFLQAAPGRRCLAACRGLAGGWGGVFWCDGSGRPRLAVHRGDGGKPWALREHPQTQALEPGRYQ